MKEVNAHILGTVHGVRKILNVAHAIHEMYWCGFDGSFKAQNLARGRTLIINVARAFVVPRLRLIWLLISLCVAACVLLLAREAYPLAANAAQKMASKRGAVSGRRWTKKRPKNKVFGLFDYPWTFVAVHG